MSGGSKKKTKTEADTTPTGTTPYARAPVAQTFQPSLPGFQDMISAQLAQGFGSGGGSAPDFAAMLQGMYRPMTTMGYQEPISATQATFDPKVNAAISTGNPILDKLLMTAPPPEDKKKK